MVFLLTYGVTRAVRSVWPTLDRFGDTLLLSALGLACVINAGRNRIYHCVLTGPLFVGGAIVAALTEAGVWHVRLGLLWTVIIVGVAAAFVAEWRATHAQRKT